MFEDVGKNLIVCNYMLELLHVHDNETIIERELIAISRKYLEVKFDD